MTEERRESKKERIHSRMSWANSRNDWTNRWIKYLLVRKAYTFGLVKTFKNQTSILFVREFLC